MIRCTSRPASVLLLLLLCAAVIRGADDPKSIWTLRENLVIGGAGAQADLFSQIAGLQVDDRGQVYVLDGQDCLIRVFDASGKFSRSFGRKGKGPGEFENPMGLSLSGQTLSVFDMGNASISRFSLEGRPIGETYLKAIGPYTSSALADSDGVVYVYGSSMNKDGKISRLIIRYCMADRTTSVLFESQPESFEPNKINPFSGHHLLQALPGGGVVWVHTGEYALNILKPDGTPGLSRTHEYKRVRITAQKKKELIRSFKENPAAKSYTLELPDFYPPIYYIAVADNGWIIVADMVNDDPGRTRFDVFGGPQYEYLGSFTHSKAEVLRVVKSRMAYFQAENEEGFPVIKRYAIELLQ